MPSPTGVVALGPAMTQLVGRLGVVGAITASALLAVATMTIGIPADPEGQGFGWSVSGPMQLAVAALVGIAGLIALRWKAFAAALMTLSATVLGLFAALEYAPYVAVLLTVALLTPAVLTWLAWLPYETFGTIVVMGVATTTLLTATAVGAREVHHHYYGPTHPESAAAEPNFPQAAWLWLGGVDEGSATVVAGGLDDGERSELTFWAGDSPPTTIGAQADGEGIARFVLDALDPSTEYGYVVHEPGAELGRGDPDGSFHTFSAGPQDLTIALGSCARSESNGAVFDAIVAADPDLYLALGDLHYGNIASTDPRDHLLQYARSLERAGQSALFRSVPTAYVWDDHDYGQNNSDASSPSRLAVSAAYRRAVPHHGVDDDPTASIAQAFTVGRVRFVMIDTRSQRTDKTMLGAEQLDWLLDELVDSSRTHALVVLGNPTPWIGEAGSSADNWSAYPDERRRIADALVAAEVDNLIMVSGDAHMLAIDDGTNSGFASDGSSGFPVLHAAALDRRGSIKGGPYSEGAFPGGGQFGILEIRDDGGPVITVEMSGRTWDGEELVHLDFEFEAA